MILDRKNMETIITYILQKKNGRLFERKQIIFFLRNIIRTNEKLCGNLKYLGCGSHGLVIKPAIQLNLIDEMDYHTKYDKSFVSKLFCNNDENEHTIYDEYLIGKKLKKIDSENNYFIYPIEIDKSSSEFTNIIMKRGYSIDNFIEKFTENDIYKIFYNLLEGLEKLIENELFNFDIKSDNILLNKIESGKYKCVFIDFTSELILENKQDFLDFCKMFKKYVHPYWPFEINCILNYFYSKNHLEYLDNDPNFFYGEKQAKFEKYQKDKKINDIFYKKYIHEHLMNDLNHNPKLFFEKIMIFQFGKMFKYLTNDEFIKYKSDTYKTFIKFLDYLVNDDYRERYTIKKIKENFKINTTNYIINIKK